MWHVILFSVLALLGFSSPAYSGEIEPLCSTVQQCKILADEGNVTALHNLATLYYSGDGVTKDLDKSISLYKQAAELGFSASLVNLGLVYYEGIINNTIEPYEGVVSDIVNRWTQAANQGDVLAQTNLGALYFNGLMVSPDNKKAYDWFLKAAQQNSKNAIRHIAFAHLLGKAVPQNREEAARWFLKAAKRGDVESQYRISEMLMVGSGIEKNTTRAIKWLTHAAEQGHPTAQMDLAIMYDERGPAIVDENGDALPVARDNTKALYWYKKAADNQILEAHEALTLIFMKGRRGVPVDKLEAVKWIKRTAEIGYAKSQRMIAVRYFHGDGIEKDVVKAYAWAKLAVQNGHKDAAEDIKFLESQLSQQQLSSGLLLFENYAAKYKKSWKEYRKLEWLVYLYKYAQLLPVCSNIKICQPLAEQGNVQAQYSLGRIYQLGLGVKIDLVKAFAWTSTADASTNTKSQISQTILNEMDFSPSMGDALRLAEEYKKIYIKE